MNDLSPARLLGLDARRSTDVVNYEFLAERFRLLVVVAVVVIVVNFY